VKVLVVTRTKMSGDYVCVGGIEVESGKSLRLLGSDGFNLSGDHPIRPGAVWHLSYRPSTTVRPPHVEDVIVSRGRLIEEVADMKTAILDAWQPWDCDLDEIFQGRLHVTPKGTAFLRDEPPLPGSSTGFWVAHTPLTLDEKWGPRYWFAGQSQISSVKYVGMAPPIATIPAGALIRFSLARWAEFPPGVGEERCYLQLSAWYT
jgi:hypothetical protein